MTELKTAAAAGTGRWSLVWREKSGLNQTESEWRFISKLSLCHYETLHKGQKAIFASDSSSEIVQRSSESAEVLLHDL